MTYEEAHKILTHEVEAGLIKGAEAICKAKEALEKQISKKLITSNFYGINLTCPSCKKQLIDEYWKKRKDRAKHCKYCGQALDWSE